MIIGIISHSISAKKEKKVGFSYDIHARTKKCMKTLQITLGGILSEVFDRTFPDANKKDKRKKNHATSLKYPHVLILEKVFVSLFYMESLHCHFSLCFMSVSVYASVYGWLCERVWAWKNPDHIKRHKTYPATENTHTDTDNFQRHQVKSHSNMKQTDSNHFRLNINHTGLK